MRDKQFGQRTEGITREGLRNIQGVALEQIGDDNSNESTSNLRRMVFWIGGAALHLEDGESAVIVEGTVEWVTPSETVAQRLAAAATAKYGYSQTATSYLAGVWRLEPIKVLAWTTLYLDATRFRFQAAD